MIDRPCRSALYVPASNDRAMAKARTLAADAILFDLEDAVAPERKTAARDTLRAALEEGGFGPRLRIVRINALGTPWGAADAAAVRGMDCDAVLLPKVEGPDDVDALARLLPDLPVWAMMETPRGVLAAAAVAAHRHVAGMVMGTNDLARDLGLRDGAGRGPLAMALQHCLLAARAAGVVIVDGVFNAYRDAAGLRADCAEGRALGFDGKSLIHPAQIDIANDAFAPTEAEIALAERRIAAHAEAGAAGQGVAVLDGEIVEGLHVAAARATLARAEAIRALARESGR